MKIRKRLIISFLILAILSAVGSIVGIGILSSTYSNFSSALTNASSSSPEEIAKINSAMCNEINLGIAVIIITVIITFIVSIIIGIAISRGISIPISKMLEASRKSAKGDFTANPDIESNDEIGELSLSFTKTMGTIKKYIDDIASNLDQIADGDFTVKSTLEYEGDFSEIKKSVQKVIASINNALALIAQTSNQVASSSDQVSSSAQAMAQGATEQASSTEELTATITDISTRVKENATHAANASRNVIEVSTEIETSNAHMNEMVEAMSQINESSSEIGKIIKTIEDIAFQTNILALNAAVEAARAGSAGKGFAVVADEVRNLASKSAEAAKNTTNLIENSLTQVENGTRIANETAQSLEKVVAAAGNVSDTVKKISETTNNQSDAIGQVAMGVEQISSVVQTNSATSEECAAASKELSEQAQILYDLINKFKIKQGNIKSANIQNKMQSSVPSYTEDTSDAPAKFSDNKY
jgi:methyl-accepting chemotaxis protein